MSFKTSVGWAHRSCNPIKGLCFNRCRLPDGTAYCYYSGKKGFAHRFHHDPTLRLDLSAFDALPQKPQKVFLCDTNDYWGDWIPPAWREAIKEKADEYPHTYLILTQFPQNIDELRPTNSWVGVTITGIQKLPHPAFLINWLLYKELPFRFVSFEPLLARIDQSVLEMLPHIDWVIIGRLTGYGTRYDPKLEWIREIVDLCYDWVVPVFLKHNLKHIWQGELIQEIPEELQSGLNG